MNFQENTNIDNRNTDKNEQNLEKNENYVYNENSDLIKFQKIGNIEKNSIENAKNALLTEVRASKATS